MRKLLIVAIAILAIQVIVFGGDYFFDDISSAQEPGQGFQLVAMAIDEPVILKDDTIIYLQDGNKTLAPKLFKGQTFVPVSLLEEVFRQEVSLETDSVIHRGNTYIPLRQAVETFGGSVYYHNGIVFISSGPLEVKDEQIKDCMMKLTEASLRNQVNTLNRWQLATRLVNKIAAYHSLPIENISLVSLEDESLIPEEARKAVQYAIGWQLLTLVTDHFFRPFNKIDPGELDRALAQLEKLLDTRPPEYEEKQLWGNNSTKEMKEELLKIIAGLEANSNYDYYVALYDFATDTLVAHNGDKPIYPASLIKTFYLLAYLEQVEKGVFSLDETYILSAADKFARGTKVAGTGSLQYQKDGKKYSYRELLSLMITISDNVASNIIQDTIGAKDLNDLAGKYGLTATRINRKFYEVTSPLPQNTTSAVDLVKVLMLLENRHLSDPASQFAIDLMKKTVNKNRIGRYISDKWEVANKTGTVSTLAGDMALIYYPHREPVAVSVVLRKKPSKGFSINQAELEIAKVAKQISEYFEQYDKPRLILDGETIKEAVDLRYINHIPYINIRDIDELDGLEQAMAVLISGRQYYSLADIAEQMGYGVDIVANQFVHLYRRDTVVLSGF